VEPQIEPVHALRVVEPVVTAKATPRSLESLETVAMVLLEELHVAEAKVCVLLSLNVPVAVKFWAVPAGIFGPIGLTEIDTRLAGTSVAGWYSSALDKTLPADDAPPATKTVPLFSRVAVWTYRAVAGFPVAENVPAVGSYSSASATLTP
jgi:hypothetical protein